MRYSTLPKGYAKLLEALLYVPSCNGGKHVEADSTDPTRNVFRPVPNGFVSDSIQPIMTGVC